MFGTDFFKMLEFVMAAIRLFARIFGDDKDRENDDKTQSNHVHEVQKIVTTSAGAKTRSVSTRSTHTA